MSVSTLSLVQPADAKSQEIVEHLKRLAGIAKDEQFVGLACLLIRKDGAVLVTRADHASRIMMLGAVTDLQHLIARDGDPDLN